MGEVLVFQGRQQRRLSGGVEASSPRVLHRYKAEVSLASPCQACPHLYLALTGLKPFMVRSEGDFRIMSYQQRDGVVIDIISDIRHIPVSFDVRRRMGADDWLRAVNVPALEFTHALQAAMTALASSAGSMAAS